MAGLIRREDIEAVRERARIEDIVVVTNLSGRPRPAPELSEVLLSWAPVGSDPSCLPAGQTLIARR